MTNFQDETQHVAKFVHFQIFVFLQIWLLKKMTYWGNYKYNI